MRVKVQAPGKGRIKTDRMLIYRLFVDHHMSQSQIAVHLGVTEPAVKKQKDKLKDAGYIKQIGKTGMFERGPEAKFYEQADPILPRVEEPLTPTEDVEVKSRHEGVVEGGSSSASPPGAHDTEVFVPVIEAHMHNGGFIFDIEKLGRITTYLRPDGSGGRKEVPLLKENINGYHGLWQYDADFSLPGEPWTAHLKLQVFKPAKKPQHAHLKISAIRVTKTVDEAEDLANIPAQAFEREVFAILDHLEKYAEYKFCRTEGRRVGRKDGQVYFSFPLPDEVKRVIPPNFTGVEGADCHMDQSPGKGKPEIESEDLQRILAIVKAKENFEEVREELARAESEAEEELAAINSRIEKGEKGLDHLRAFAEKRLFEVYRMVTQVIDALHMVAQVQVASVHVDAVKTAVSTMEGAATATASTTEEVAPERRDVYSSFYR